MAEVQFWLNRALQQALRSCPAGDNNMDWDTARRREDGIWGRVLGLEGDDPMLQRLRIGSLTGETWNELKVVGWSRAVHRGSEAHLGRLLEYVGA